MVLIKTQKQLSEMLYAIKDETILGIDTEFVRTRTYYPILCLLQLSSPSHCYIIDVLKIADLSPLFTKLYDPKTLWVLHSGYQDIDILYQCSKQLPAQVFDTQIASELLNLSWQVSYQALCQSLLNKTVDKSYTRFNWQSRPLPNAALNYAKTDVLYLVPLYLQLKQPLMVQNKQHWLAEEVQHLIHKITQSEQTKTQWQQLKGVQKLHPEHYPLAYQLCAWRLGTATQKNKPKQWVLKDENIITMAMGKSTIKPNILAQLPPPPTIPLILEKTQLSQSQQTQLKNFKVQLLALAQQYNVHPKTIAGKKQLIGYLKGNKNTRLNSGWRAQILSEIAL